MTGGRDPARGEVTEDEMDAVIALVGRHLDETRPIPPGLVDAAIGAYAWRFADAELLELLSDSADDELALVRAEQPTRLMAFGTESRGVHFECQRTGTSYRLDGLVQPPAPVVVVVERPGATTTARTDEVGSFSVDGLAPGTVRLLVRELDGRVAMVTPWFVLDS